jgi:transcription termination/antitermination protein NusA
MPDDDIGAVAHLFSREVPEIAAGAVEIVAIARKPGYRCKLVVRSLDPRVDCVAACVGIRGCRIKNVIDALDGERIDVIRWNNSPAELIANALQPAAIERVILHSTEHRAVVVVQLDQVSLILGRRGENRQLASELTGWQIEVKEL